MLLKCKILHVGGAVWQKAREKALTPAQVASPLGRRPYDLRHSAVPTGLAVGVPSAEVARRAGHSTAVLHRIYTHVLHGWETQANQQIETALEPAADGEQQ